MLISSRHVTVSNQNDSIKSNKNDTQSFNSSYCICINDPENSCDGGYMV